MPRRAEPTAIVLPQENAPSAPLRCGTFTDKWLQIDGIGVGTYTVQGRMAASGPGSAWQDVAAVTTDAVVEIAPLFFEIRVDVTGYSSGAPTAVLGALDARTL